MFGMGTGGIPLAKVTQNLAIVSKLSDRLPVTTTYPDALTGLLRSNRVMDNSGS